MASAGALKNDQQRSQKTRRSDGESRALQDQVDRTTRAFGPAIASDDEPNTAGKAKVTEVPWPEHELHDLTLEAFMRRLSEHQKLLVERGKFPSETVLQAFVGNDSASKEKIAQWLRAELAILRDGERRIGAAPVLNGQALPRLVIADIAMTMVESLSEEVGDHLIVLIQVLLDVDRHRRALATKPSEKFGQAAAIEAQLALQGRTIGVRSLARIVSASPASVTSWRRSRDYQGAVEDERRTWDDLLRREYFPIINADHPNLGEAEAFRIAFQMYRDGLSARRSGVQEPRPDQTKS